MDTTQTIINNDQYDECIICMTPIKQIKVTICPRNHYLCMSCLQSMLQHNDNKSSIQCAYCKYEQDLSQFKQQTVQKTLLTPYHYCYSIIDENNKKQCIVKSIQYYKQSNIKLTMKQAATLFDKILLLIMFDSQFDNTNKIDMDQDYCHSRYILKIKKQHDIITVYVMTNNYYNTKMLIEPPTNQFALLQNEFVRI